MKWLALLVAPGCLLPLALVARTSWDGVQERVDALQHAAHRVESRRGAELEALRAELTVLRAAVGRLPGDELARRVAEAEDLLGDLEAARSDQEQAIAGLEAARREFGPAVLEARLERLDADQTDRIEALEELVAGTTRLVEAGAGRPTADDDLDRLWSELVGPVVQLAGDTSVGSGVLLASRRAGADEWRTHVLTAWHVVRDIQGDLSRRHEPVPVTIYRPDGSVERETATLLDFQADIDAALLVLDRTEPVRFGTRLAPRGHVESVRTFDEIVAVGCPLGNDPIPTRGEVATARHEVDGETYWMINAPTYIGNSGGPIFDAETHELLGIFSKIYTHGSLRPTVVPHMGLVTPLDRVYTWMEEVGYGHLVPEDAADTERSMAVAER